MLEVGCGSGYYSEVFATLLPGGVRYTGIDYSDAMIARARAHYPSTAFEVADATRMPYADAAFDIVFNGVSLMHIVDYQAAIREAARVASHYCIFHTVPVFDESSNNLLAKIRLWRAGRRSRFRQAGTDVVVRASRTAARARMAVHPLRRVRV